MVSVQHEEGAVTQRAVPGPALYFTSSMPKGGASPKALVGILHGYAEHAARYSHVMDAWAGEGIGSVALDLRGHGRATGPRGYCARFDEFLDDAAELARLLADRARGAPLFLMGHSFGGLVAATSVIEAPRSWRGLILSAPYFGLALQVPPAKALVGRIASRVAPRLAIPSGLHGADMTHDSTVARAYDEDPLIFKTATARWFRESTKAQTRILARASSFNLPLYVTFGTADRVAQLESGRAFYERASSRDKTWDAREGLFHEVLNEPSWPELAAKVRDWILARV